MRALLYATEKQGFKKLFQNSDVPEKTTRIELLISWEHFNTKWRIRIDHVFEIRDILYHTHIPTHPHTHLLFLFSL